MAALWHCLPSYRSLLQRSVCPSIWTGWLGRAPAGRGFRTPAPCSQRATWQLALIHQLVAMSGLGTVRTPLHPQGCCCGLLRAPYTPPPRVTA